VQQCTDDALQQLRGQEITQQIKQANGPAALQHYLELFALFAW
jgi:hypothetical protein